MDQKTISKLLAVVKQAATEWVSDNPIASPDDDPLYNKAKLVAQSAPRLCIANLQRALAIGYNRAARLMGVMVSEGLVEQFDPGFGGVGYRLVVTKQAGG